MTGREGLTGNPFLSQVRGNIDRIGYDAGTKGPFPQFLDMINCILQHSHSVHNTTVILRRQYTRAITRCHCTGLMTVGCAECNW